MFNDQLVDPVPHFETVHTGTISIRYSYESHHFIKEYQHSKNDTFSNHVDGIFLRFFAKTRLSESEKFDNNTINLAVRPTFARPHLRWPAWDDKIRRFDATLIKPVNPIPTWCDRDCVVNHWKIGEM